MLDAIPDLLQLSAPASVLVVAAVFAAGVVRGFSGFALSALTMACLVTVLPPIALIPICWVLETSASLTMLRAGLAQADRRLAITLATGNVLGLPLGLYATRSLDPDASRLAALLLILALAALQLRRGARPAAPATRAPPEPANARGETGLRAGALMIAAGLAAGLASGLASVGGMVIALYLLARDLPVATVRASLVLFLAFSMPATGAWLAFTGVLDGLALQRGLLLAPVVLLGVAVGRRLFDPNRQQLYRRVCLGLLMLLAVLGLLQQLT